MGAMRNLYEETELARLREENEALREQVERLERMAEQYLMALLTRAINEGANDA